MSIREGPPKIGKGRELLVITDRESGDREKFEGRANERDFVSTSVIVVNVYVVILGPANGKMRVTERSTRKRVLQVDYGFESECARLPFFCSPLRIQPGAVAGGMGV